MRKLAVCVLPKSRDKADNGHADDRDADLLRAHETRGQNGDNKVCPKGELLLCCGEHYGFAQSVHSGLLCERLLLSTAAHDA
jgi:hypothetical protein